MKELTKMNVNQKKNTVAKKQRNNKQKSKRAVVPTRNNNIVVAKRRPINHNLQFERRFFNSMMRKREKLALELYLYGAIITKTGFITRDFVMPHSQAVRLQTHTLPMDFKLSSDAQVFQKWIFKPSSQHMVGKVSSAEYGAAVTQVNLWNNMSDMNWLETSVRPVLNIGGVYKYGSYYNANKLGVNTYIYDVGGDSRQNGMWLIPRVNYGIENLKFESLISPGDTLETKRYEFDQNYQLLAINTDSTLLTTTNATLNLLGVLPALNAETKFVGYTVKGSRKFLTASVSMELKGTLGTNASVVDEHPYWDFVQGANTAKILETQYAYYESMRITHFGLFMPEAMDSEYNIAGSVNATRLNGDRVTEFIDADENNSKMMIRTNDSQHLTSRYKEGACGVYRVNNVKQLILNDPKDTNWRYDEGFNNKLDCGSMILALDKSGANIAPENFNLILQGWIHIEAITNDLTTPKASAPQVHTPILDVIETLKMKIPNWTENPKHFENFKGKVKSIFKDPTFQQAVLGGLKVGASTLAAMLI